MMLREGADSIRGFKKVRHVPGVSGLPFLGNFFDLTQNFDGFLKQQYDAYGPLSRIGMVGHDSLLALGPELVEQLFMDRDRVFSNKLGYRDSIGLFYENGLLALDHEEHKRHRRFTQNAFKNHSLAKYIDGMNAVYAKHMAAWQDDRDILFYPRIKNILLEVAAEIFLGFEKEELGERSHLINDAFVNVTEGILSIFLVDMPGFKYHKAMNGKRFLESFMLSMIDERRVSDKVDIFTQLCHEKDDEGNYLSDEDIISSINFLMFAAHDTTSSALTHMVYLLSQNVGWQERLREECLSLHKEVLDFEDLDKLKDLDNAFLETIRLHPSAPILARATTKDVEMAGQIVPAHTYINLCPSFNHRMEEWWTEPDEFDPERFAPHRAEHKRHVFNYVPFGGGAHKCIGMHFANMQVKAFMHQLLVNFRLNTPIDYTPKLQAIPLPKPVDDLPLNIERNYRR